MTEMNYKAIQSLFIYINSFDEIYQDLLRPTTRMIAETHTYIEGTSGGETKSERTNTNINGNPSRPYVYKIYEMYNILIDSSNKSII